MVFVHIYIHFRQWTRIQKPRVNDPDPAKVKDPCGSESGSKSFLENLMTVLRSFVDPDPDPDPQGSGTFAGSGSVNRGFRIRIRVHTRK
jgi:hypothetical protein